MKRNYIRNGLFFLAFLLLGSTLSSFTGKDGDDRSFTLKKNMRIFNSIVREVETFYVDTMDVDKSFQSGINAFLMQLDPYTNYFSEDNMGDLKYMTTGKYGGIGSIVSYHKKEERVVINEPYPGLPAAKAGLKAGDVIMKIDTIDLKNVSVSDVSEQLKGEVGTKLTLVIKRPGEKELRTFSIKRASIKISPVPYHGFVRDSIGYISLSGFTKDAAKILKLAFVELKQKGAKSLILDLRNNGGGLINEAIDIVNLFVPKGKEIVATKGKIKQWDQKYITNNHPIDTTIPITILVNSSTASASEIVSGSLQDLDRAVVVGRRTYGKGLVQSTRSLPYGGSLKVTIAKYYIPSGRCIQAIDYKHRNKDGSVGRIPDSLTTVFHTANGREVRDGGGILPDTLVQQEQLPNILFYLVRDNLIFDFATQYCIGRDKIAPVEQFEVTDSMYQQFKKTVKSADFTYDRQSEKILTQLKKVAKFEGYEKGAAKEFAALEKKLTHNLDHDLDYFSKDIKRLIATEIVKRYYYQAGSAIESLKHDSDLEVAVAILKDSTLYQQMLAPTHKTIPLQEDTEEEEE